MANDFENRSTHIIHENGQTGSVQIADDVVAIIAALATSEVEGVASIAEKSAGKFTAKSVPKGVKVSVVDSDVSVDLAITLKYGYSIPKVAMEVQEKVKAAIENMTGLEVVDVNLRIIAVEAE